MAKIKNNAQLTFNEVELEELSDAEMKWVIGGASLPSVPQIQLPQIQLPKFDFQLPEFDFQLPEFDFQIPQIQLPQFQMPKFN